MNKRNPIKYVLLTIITLVVVAVTILGIRAVWAQKSQPHANADVDPRTVKEAFRRGGFKEAAKIRGHYVSTFDPHWDWARFDIEALTKNSLVVVVGVPSKDKARLSPDGDMITTDYNIAIKEVIKGDAEPRATITVALPGGRVTFEDGSTAELQTPGLEEVVNGSTYIFFLSDRGIGDNVYMLTGGPQGLLELPTDGSSVKSYGRSTDPVVKQAKDKNAEIFLKEVRKQAEKWPQPSKCCS